MSKMMKTELKTKKVCVVDHGLFLPLALKLSEAFGTVWYVTPWEKSMPLLQDSVIGDGFENLYRISDPWEVFDESDLYIFPDIQHSWLQGHLKAFGKPVWGSMWGDDLETHRVQFLDTVDMAGLPVPKWTVAKGLDELRAVLRENENKWIKLSKYRGTMETWHHATYKTSEPMLDQLAVKLGPLKNLLTFVIVDDIKTDIEVGYDGFSIDGKFPSLAVQGYEAKDEALLASVQEYKDLPEQVRRVNEAFAPTLAAFGYRNFWSTEIRVKDGEPYFIDPTCRMPSPSGEAQIELYSNLGEIIWAGAHGELVDPVPAAKFACEVMIEHKDDAEHWRTIEVPDEYRQWVKVYFACEHDGAWHIPPTTSLGNTIGAIVGIGDTMEDAIAHAHETGEALKDQPIMAHWHAVPELLMKIEAAEKQGMEFTDQPLPEPADVPQML